MSNVAARAEDELTYLKCRANVAGVLSEQYEFDEAWAECREVLRRARAAGLAYPIAQCEITSAAVLGRGSDQSLNNEALSAGEGHRLRRRPRHDLSGVRPPSPPHRTANVDRPGRGPVATRRLRARRSCLRHRRIQRPRSLIAAAIESDNPVREMRRKARLLAILNEMPGRTVEADALAA